MSTQLIDSLIREIEAKIDSTDLSPERVNSGEVISLGDGIAKVVGLREVAYNEVVEFESRSSWGCHEPRGELRRCRSTFWS